MAGTTTIFVINLDRRIDRRKLISKRLAKLGLKWERISAVDGNDPDLVDKVDWRKHRYYTQLLPPQKGAIGCYFSHRSVWERIVKDNIEQALVLEDDVAPTADWDPAILNLDLASLGLESLRLDQSRHLGPMPMSKYFEIPVGRWLAKNINSWGAGAHLITRAGAKKCLQPEKMWTMADDYFMMNRMLNLKTAALTPALWWHPEETVSDVAMPVNYYAGSSQMRKTFSFAITSLLRERERLRFQFTAHPTT